MKMDKLNKNIGKSCIVDFKTGILMLLVGIAMIGMTMSSVSALTISSPTTTGLKFLGDTQISVSTNQASAYATFKKYDAPDTKTNDYYVVWMQATGMSKPKTCFLGFGDGRVKVVQPKVTLLRSDEYVTDWSPPATVNVGGCSTQTFSLDSSVSAGDSKTGASVGASVSQTFTTCGDKLSPFVASKYFYPKWQGNEVQSVASIGGVEYKTNTNGGYSINLGLYLESSC